MTELSLELADLGADAGLGNVQAAAARVESLLGNSDEILQLTKSITTDSSSQSNSPRTPSSGAARLGLTESFNGGSGQ